MAQGNQIRIIGGKWRGRKLKFPPIETLRPTPNRVRETLFNWLSPVIKDAHCLDLFAGSGALGFEALSRGAKHVVFIEQNKKILEYLTANQEMLGCVDAEALCLNAEDYLKQTSRSFDIVFLDPPFHLDLISKCCTLLESKKLLAHNAHIYIETETKPEHIQLPDGWEILKHKKAGQVYYYLVRRQILFCES